jgi:hypothetical protein
MGGFAADFFLKWFKSFIVKYNIKILLEKYNFKSLFPHKTPSMAFCDSSWGQKELINSSGIE